MRPKRPELVLFVNGIALGVLEQQPRQGPRAMVTEESHHAAGQRYRLDVAEHDGPATVRIRGRRTLEMLVRPGTGVWRS